MFNNARSFNQDLSSWDVSKGINFVSGLGPWDSDVRCCRWCHLRRHAFGLLGHCRCYSWYLGCWQHVCCVAHTCIQYCGCHAHEEQHHEFTQSNNKLSIKQHNSHTITLVFYFTISSLIWIYMAPLFLQFNIQRRECLGMLRLSTKTFQAGTSQKVFIL